MSKKSTAAALLASAGVLVAGCAVATANGQTVTSPSVEATSQAATTSATTSATASASSAASASTATSAATTKAATTAATTAATKAATTAAATSSYKDGTYTGSTSTHQFGSVTVTVTISGGKISAVTANVVDDGDRKSQQINSSAIPTIKARVLAANSASVATVSGATYTTKAFLSSLQSALSKAKA